MICNKCKQEVKEAIMMAKDIFGEHSLALKKLEQDLELV